MTYDPILGIDADVPLDLHGAGASVPPDLNQGRFRMYSTDELMSLPPPEWLVRGLLIEDSVACLYGPPGSLKSFFGISMAMSIASGIDFLDHRTQHGAVCYVAAEGAAGLGKRIGAWKARYGRTGERDLFSLIRSIVNIMDPAEVANLGATIRDKQAETGQRFRLVVVDTLAKSMSGGDENSAREMGMAIKGALTLQADLGCCVLLIHHTGKDRGKGPRGSNALEGGCETIMLIERKPGDPNLTIRIEKQKDEEDSLDYTYRAEKVDFEHPTRGHVNSLVICRHSAESEEVREARRHADQVSIAYQCKPGTSTTISRLIGLLGQGWTRSTGSYDRIKDAVPMSPQHVLAQTSHGRFRLRRDDTSPPSILCEIDA